ncbi:hypothetical protein HaLaN_06200, partial [Haematococcus lacustris]
MLEANKKLHTALWWLALYGGAWFAWQQGWLPFFPPPRPLPQPRTTRSPAASEEPQASAPEASAPAPLDPTTEASHQAAIAALTARAQQHAAKMNDTTLTIEHM